MDLISHLGGRLVAAILALALIVPAADAYALQATQDGAAPASGPQEQRTIARNEPAPVALPDNPEPQQPGAQQPAPQQPEPQQPATPQSTPANPTQQPEPQQPNGNNKPMGTAAAPYEKTVGVPASRPAGAVIAPAKQRRVRTIWISVAAVVGAGIAVGSVVGLSKASSSRP